MSHPKKRVGFVPTMGALHDGHLSLIHKAKKQTEICVCSIFVNPGQFNESSDLHAYPRVIDQDIEKLCFASCDVLFYPSVEEVYPPGLDTRLNLPLDHLMQPLEGSFRPGHFQGMVEVVKRLLDIVEPQYLFMGQKDFQQLSIVRGMIEHLGLDVKLQACPIIREESGLAMSSRNVRLSERERKIALEISKTLIDAKENLTKETNLEEVGQNAYEYLKSQGLKPEYFRFVNSRTLKDVSKLADAEEIIALVAAWVGEVRLIDNLIIKN